jgi:hypothetical protein
MFTSTQREEAALPVWRGTDLLKFAITPLYDGPNDVVLNPSKGPAYPCNQFLQGKIHIAEQDTLFRKRLHLVPSGSSRPGRTSAVAGFGSQFFGISLYYPATRTALHHSLLMIGTSPTRLGDY